MSASDPGIPAGWLDTQGSDGATPEALQIYVAGIASGGFPSYGDPARIAPLPKQPNGILS
jgi:hypothetical protein